MAVGRTFAVAAVVVLNLAAPVVPAIAQSDTQSSKLESVEDFYRGKQIRVVVGSDAGGGYDAYGRLVAAYIGKYIPGNPNIIVQNMAGAGSMIATNHVANVAPKDGTVIGAIHPDAVTAPLFRPDKAKYDSRKFIWLGSPVSITYTVTVWHTAPIKTFDELFTKELIVASSGGESTVLPLLANGVLGTKFKVITGYKSASAGFLAIERGEAQGNGGDALNALKSVHGDRLRDGTVRIIAAYGMKPNPELAGVPRVLDYAKTPEQREELSLIFSTDDFGWPYIMAGEVPADRARAVQAAFEKAMTDKDLLADAAKRRLDITPVRAEEQAKLVADTFNTRAEVVEKVKRMIGE
jgi:tripartite-type tricarboxylate transporter receptor subunit TctC